MPPRQPPRHAIILTDWPACERAHTSLLVADTLRRKLEADRDQELQRVRDQYEKDDPAHPERMSIERFAAQAKALRAAIEHFAFTHRDGFGDSKTRAVPDGTVQLKLGNPALHLLGRKWSWDSVLEAIKRGVKHGRALVMGWLRIKEEIEKTAILAAARDGTASPADLAEFGMRVDQAETLIIRDREGKDIPD